MAYSRANKKVEQWRADNPQRAREAYRRADYRKTFGLEVEEYEALLLAQGGRCKICGNEESAKARNGGVRRLSIDHCHSTGVIRGLLCYRCNYILGLAKENVQLFAAAILYIETADTGHRIAPSASPTASELVRELLQLKDI